MSLRQTKFPWKDWKKSKECGILSKNELGRGKPPASDSPFGSIKEKEDKEDVRNTHNRKRTIKGLCQRSGSGALQHL